MNPSILLGRIAGVRIGINWSWLVVFALIAWSLESSVFPDQNPHLSKTAYIGMAIAAAFLFFACLADVTASDSAAVVADRRADRGRDENDPSSSPSRSTASMERRMMSR